MVSSPTNNINNYFVNLQIKKIIIHFLVRDFNSSSLKLQCSEELAKIGERGVETLTDRILSAIGENSHALEMYFNSTEGAFEEIVKSYAPDFEDDEFIETSKKLTTLLYSAQNNNRKIPDGAVRIIQGYIGYPSVAVL